MGKTLVRSKAAKLVDLRDYLVEKLVETTAASLVE